MDSNKRKVDNTEIGGSSNGLSDPKRRRRSRKSHADYCLPDDVVFIILMSFPADVLYNVMRLVCRQWFNLIQSPLFISTHLKKYSKTKCLLIRRRRISGHVVKLWSDPGGRGPFLKVEDINLSFGKRVCGSCNGLLYVIGPIESTSNCPSYVVNPVTKQYLPLPLFPNYLVRDYCSFGYAAASRVYKVMHESRWLILTVGVDKAWRDIDISQLSETAKRVMSSSYRCLTLRGFVYWLGRSDPIILRFDMETETFAEIPIPLQFNLSPCSSGIIAMESSLCLWSRKSYLYKFWLLKHSEIGDGQWEKLLEINDINVQDQRCLPVDNEPGIAPLGWLRSRELLVFGKKAAGIRVYNVNTGRVHQTKGMNFPTIERKNHGNSYYSLQLCSESHVDSLVPLNNLSLIMTPQLPFKSPDEVYSKENMSAEFQEFKEEL